MLLGLVRSAMLPTLAAMMSHAALRCAVLCRPPWTCPALVKEGFSGIILGFLA